MLIALTASGCHRYLVATPNLLHDQNPYAVFDSCPENCQTTEAPVLYATDRANENERNDRPTYGTRRAKSLAFGVANVSLGSNLTWKELIKESTQATRTNDCELTLGDVRELGRRLEIEE